MPKSSESSAGARLSAQMRGRPGKIENGESGRVAAWQEAPCASAWPTRKNWSRLNLDDFQQEIVQKPHVARSLQEDKLAH